MHIPCPICNALHWKDEENSSSTLSTSKFGSCCRSASQTPPISLPNFRDPPDALKNLYDGDSPQSRHFRLNIWKYNRAFAFTSIKANVDHTINARAGAPVYRVQGELYHQYGPIEAPENQEPTYSQLYILDPQAALEHRKDANSDLRPDVLQIIQDVIRTHHQYAPAFRHAYEILHQYNCENDVALIFRIDPTKDSRRYNLPTAQEVAVLLPHPGQKPALQDIILYHRSGMLRHITYTHASYASLYYVLFFPYGDDGWHPDIVHYNTSKGPKRLSQTKFTAYFLFSRPGVYSTLLRGRSLFQRYLVDMFAAIDQNRLQYHFYHQSDLRACLYSGLMDATGFGDDDVDLGNLGQRYVLPSSYIGGPRHMQQRYQDAMAIARYFRRVDIFLTVTCNPAWPEITRELLPHQTSYDRPDIVARVFELKKKAIIADIHKNGIFGHCVAYVYTIEFQKRGLPHMHCLIFLQDQYKLTTAEAVDSCIRAYWPDPILEPRLFEVVKQCMVHGPCGTANPTAVCMDTVTKTCKRRFPKEFVESTILEDNSFPKYRRPDDGCAYDVRGVPTDNRWIVPYSPYILATYQCHANVECAVSLGALQYLFKYTHKGGDCAAVEEVNDRNEIQNYLDGRYISASEAAHRIFQFTLHDHNPPVTRLQVHLPGQHMVVFDPHEDQAAILSRASKEKTTLTAYFEANKEDGSSSDWKIARLHTYAEFPQYFRWIAATKKWQLRKKNLFAIGRMYFVPPTAGERFYLRLLLTVVRGPTSFDDLKTINGVLYPTFYDSCRLRGLLEDDGEWDMCLAEASEVHTGTRLRHLFDTLLRFCAPSDPGLLWMRYRPAICSDLSYRLQTLGFRQDALTEEDIYDYGLYLLEQLLEASGLSLHSFPSMPYPRKEWGRYRVNALISEQLDFLPANEQSYHDTHFPQLNEGQLAAYNAIIQSIAADDGKSYFVNGPGTYVIFDSEYGCLILHHRWNRKDLFVQGCCEQASGTGGCCCLCRIIWHCCPPSSLGAYCPFHLQDPPRESSRPVVLQHCQEQQPR